MIQKLVKVLFSGLVSVLHVIQQEAKVTRGCFIILNIWLAITMMCSQVVQEMEQDISFDLDQVNHDHPLDSGKAYGDFIIPQVQTFDLSKDGSQNVSKNLRVDVDVS